MRRSPTLTALSVFALVEKLDPFGTRGDRAVGALLVAGAVVVALSALLRA